MVHYEHTFHEYNVNGRPRGNGLHSVHYGSYSSSLTIPHSGDRTPYVIGYKRLDTKAYSVS